MTARASSTATSAVRADAKLLIRERFVGATSVGTDLIPGNERQNRSGLHSIESPATLASVCCSLLRHSDPMAHAWHNTCTYRYMHVCVTRFALCLCSNILHLYMSCSTHCALAYHTILGKQNRRTRLQHCMHTTRSLQSISSEL